MGWRRSGLEAFVWASALLAPRAWKPPKSPAKIFVLRNNDIGDLLVVTPLFEALKKTFPGAEIIAGIGSWNTAALVGNPHVDRIVELNAPWHNHFVRPQTVQGAFQYVLFSGEAKALKSLQAKIGIDVLGSGFGSLLMMRAGIPYRLGVRGYAGGESAAQSVVDYRPDEHVGRQALRFAEILGCSELPENRPQIFLDGPAQPNGAIVIAPGAGEVGKAWPSEYFVKLAGLLESHEVIVIGSGTDVPLAERVCGSHARARNLAGKLTLRESFAVIAGATLVVCNSSMPVHVAAGFRRRCVTLLGEAVGSASQHHRKWGYPETVMLGRDEGHPEIFSPREAAAKIQEALSQS
jgi:ADP-heptose:LPS heptosyltransferase